MKALERVICAGLALLATCHAAGVNSKAKSLRFEAPPIEPSVVLPMQFNQQLIVCNAYPGIFPVTMRQNGQEPQVDQRDIRFQECRQMSGQVRAKDKLDFTFEDSGIAGAFVIGSLPSADEVLLLVVQRRDASSPLVAFQSFAFSSHSDGKNAQLAVIDTFVGSSSSPHLRMEDHVDSKEKKTISKRVEQLSFNRIYAIEEGAYDTSISDHNLDKTGGADTSKTTIHLAKKHNYVILRAGDEQFHQSLFVYPPQLEKSRAGRLSFSLIAAVLPVVLARLF